MGDPVHETYGKEAAPKFEYRLSNSQELVFCYLQNLN